MKSPFHFVTTFVVILIILLSCTTQNQPATPDKIENTIQSVSYFRDTVGYDPQQLLDLINQYNAAIDEIGYPDAGYKIWLNQEEPSEIRFMLEGHWPTQTIYDEIHDHPLYQEVTKNNEGKLDGLTSAAYHRFTKVK